MSSTLPRQSIPQDSLLSEMESEEIDKLRTFKESSGVNREDYSDYKIRAHLIADNMRNSSSHNSSHDPSGFKRGTTTARGEGFSSVADKLARDDKWELLLYVVAIYNVIVVPLRLGFFCFAVNYSELYLVWVVVELVFIDSVTVMDYKRNLKFRRKVHAHSQRKSTLRLSSFDSLAIRKVSRPRAGLRLMCKVLYFLARVPVLESCVLLSQVWASGQREGFEAWCIARVVKLFILARLGEFRASFQRGLERLGYTHGTRTWTRYFEIFTAGLILSHALGCFWHMLPLIGYSQGLNICNGLQYEIATASAHQVQYLENKYGWFYLETQTCLISAHLTGWSESKAASCGPCATPFEEYLRSVYWALTTVAAVGYGDITPKTVGETIFALFAELVSIILNVLLLSSITSMISNADAARLAYNRRLFMVKSFLKAKDVPKSTQNATAAYFDLLWSRQEGFEDAVLLNQLPASLQQNIHYSVFSRVLLDCPTFDMCDPDFLTRILSKAVVTIYMPREHIYVAGTRATEMYGICSGVVTLRYNNRDTSEELIFEADQGSMFGHFEFLLDKPYMCSATAAKQSTHNQTFTEVFSVNEDDFETVAVQYGDYNEGLETVAQTAVESGRWQEFYDLKSRKQCSGESGSNFSLDSTISDAKPSRRSMASINARRRSLVSESIEAFSSSTSGDSVTVDGPQATAGSGVFAARATPSGGGSLVFDLNKTGKSISHGIREASAADSARKLDTKKVLASRSSHRLVLGGGNFGGATNTTTPGKDKNLMSGRISLSESAFASGTHAQEKVTPTDSSLFVFCQVFSVIGTICYLVLIPTRIAFLDEQQQLYTFPFALFLDIFFWGEFLFRVMSLFKVEDKSIVQERYKLSLLFDFLTMLPIDLSFAMNGSWGTWSVVRLIRLLKVFRLLMYLENAEEVVERRSAGRRLDHRVLFSFRLSLVFVIVSFWMVSFWCILGQKDALQQGFGAWTIFDPVIRGLSCDEAAVLTCIANSRLAHVFGRAMYWAMTTMTTVGYGDIVALSAAETAVALVSISVASLLLYPAIVANISVLQGGPSDAGNISRDGDPVDVLVERTRGCIGLYDLGNDALRNDIKTYLDNVGAEAFDTQEVLHSIPPWLGEKVAYALYKDYVLGLVNENQCGGRRVARHSASDKIVPVALVEEFSGVFGKCAPEFVRELCYKLKPEIVPAHTTIAHHHEVPTSCNFVMKGIVEVLDHGDKSDELGVYRELVPGKYFGVLEISQGNRYTRSYRAQETVTVLTISRADYVKVLSRYPNALAVIKMAANRYNGDKSVTVRNRSPTSRAGLARSTTNKRVSCMAGGAFPGLYIDPFSRTRQVFDVLSMFLELLSHMLIPLGIGAITNSYCSLKSDSWILFYVLCNGLADVFSVIDMILNSFFFAVVDDDDQLITGHWEIFQRYVKSKTFWIDIIATIPFDWIVLFALGGSTSNLYITNWLRLLKVIRVLDLRNYVKRLEILLVENWKIRKNNVQLLRLMLVLCVFAHWLACFWMRFTNETDSLGQGHFSWAHQDCVLTGTCFPNSTSVTLSAGRHKCVQYLLFKVYIRGLYWVFVTLNTVGYGDIYPVTAFETLFALSVMLLGAAMYALLIASLANVVANLDKTATTFKKLQEDIRTYVAHRRLPQSLRDKITTYTDQMWVNQRGGVIGAVTEFLPSPVRIQVYMEWDKGQIAQHPLFKNIPSAFLISLLRNSQPICYAPGDTIFVAGQPARSMYILTEGEACLLAADGNTTVSKHTNKGVFGVEEFYGCTKLNTTLQAASFCQMLLICRDDLLMVMGNFPCSTDTLASNAENMKNTSEVLKLAGNLKSRKVTKMMAIEAESLNTDKSGIHPGESRRCCWEMTMFFVTLYILLSVPFRIGFFADVDYYKLEGALLAWVILDVLVVNLLGVIDMYFHRTKFSFFREGAIISNLDEIKANYKLTWQLHDCIATVPVDLVVLVIVALSGYGNTFQVWSWARIFTVWRCRRLSRYFIPLIEFYLQEASVQLSAGLIRVIRKLFFTVALVHWNACIWYLIAIFEGLDSSWALNESLQLDTSNPEMNVPFAYMRSFYYSLTTLTAVGYGDIVPKTLLETIFVVFVLLTSLYNYIDLVANVSTLISNADSSYARQETVRNAIMNMLSMRDVSRNIQLAVEDFLDSQTLLAKHGINEAELLKFLPASIRSEISNHLHFHPLSAHPCFKGVSKHCIYELVSTLQNQLYVNGDMLSAEGNKVMELSLIFSGKVQLFSNGLNLPGVDEDKASSLVPQMIRGDTPPDLLKPVTQNAAVSVRGKTFRKGDIIGVEMLLEVPMIKTAVSVAVTEVYQIKRQDFIDVLNHFPEELPKIQSAALELCRELVRESGFRTITLSEKL